MLMRIHTGKLVGHVVLLALSFVSSAASAQNREPPEAPRIRSEVREVLVPVVITDRRGRHISGLKSSDFQVFEDGKLQRVVAFSTETMIQQPSGPTAAQIGDNRGGARTEPTSPGATGRTYLIIIDTLHSSFANFGRVRGVLAKFFEKEQSSDAQYAVIALGREAKVVQDLTRDTSAVLATVRASGFSRTIQDSEAANLAIAADRFTTLMRQYCSVCECAGAGNHGEQPECLATKSRVQAFLTTFAAQTFLLNQRFLRQLTQIVHATAGVPASRTIVFISDGFNRFPGRELYGILMGYAPKDRSFEFNPRDTQPELEALLKTATKDDVKFYTVDSRGLYTMASPPGGGFDASRSSSTVTQMDSRVSPNLAAGLPEPVLSQAHSAARENTDTLSELARETGGLFFKNSNDLMKGIRQAVSDGREYYVLAYVPQNGVMDGKYRKISVTVKNRKWRVNAKAGYWASGSE